MMSFRTMGLTNCAWGWKSIGMPIQEFANEVDSRGVKDVRCRVTEQLTVVSHEGVEVHTSPIYLNLICGGNSDRVTLVIGRAH